MIFLIDNYDSFVYNLARYFAELGCDTHVARNDEVTVDDIATMNPSALVLSPGPCTPKEAGICCQAVTEYSGKLPILGVCLGHQAIAEALGGDVIQAPEPVHGKTSKIQHSSDGMFAELPNPLKATRYHSLIVDAQTMPSCLLPTAHTADGLVMGIQHQTHPTFGVQFHPESILTDSGHVLLANFLRIAGIEVADIPAGEFVEDSSGQTSVDLDQPLHW